MTISLLSSGTFPYLMGTTSSFFVVFLLAALASMFSERSGVVNLGVEGYMTIGALTFAITTNKLYSGSDWTQVVGFLTAFIVAGIFSLLHIFASLKLKCDQIISGTAINLLAQGIGLFVVTSGVIGDPTKIDTFSFKISLDSNDIFTIYLIISMIIIAVMGIYFSLTRTGKRHIAAGENPNALEAAGISVLKYRFWCVMLSSAIAGIAGAFYVMNRTSGSFYGSVNGFGFLGLAIMIAGQWRIKFITLFSAIFALFFAIADVLPVMVTSFPQGDWVKALPFIFSLIAMMAISRMSKPPAASGVPYDKSAR
ncbi:ribose/galactose ABC transporter permease [Spiroplasma clarkii]|uniref:Ribose/galactose ABC transporter permease n=1 Tax=Spiroplasma clarkii TaxID=2139 RepID=A0A1Y0L2P3_9MOLU|nr:ABC transporter permease [Spiroplasma clarkii]ARU92276.1 ribose/galactose ABC transporter permease [Spiroplasma clarkii]ATX71588.1 ribose/galactose ABC transporter permease [Spiroplasma clarkii]